MRRALLFTALLWCAGLTYAQTMTKHPYAATADTILHRILNLYQTEEGYLSETYPVNPNQQIGYLAAGTEKKMEQKSAFLWPYSGMFSGCVALYEATGDKRYRKILNTRILPGLKKYWDDSRLPACYQSYPRKYGQHGRYYDDNIWVALDYCDLYSLTNKRAYLKKAIALYQYIYSGWNDELGGGIFWCEQQRTGKHTCSNAPSTVLGVKLYRLTKDRKYLDKAIETYRWTRTNLCDPEDHLYWDNINLKKQIGRAKFSYNSGQMIEAGVLLYEETGDESYLKDAQATAASADRFFRSKPDLNNPDYKVHKDMSWFNVILYRGFEALSKVDGNRRYADALVENAYHAWRNYQDENGLVGRDWSGRDKEEFKWLLDNACLIELFATYERT